MCIAQTVYKLHQSQYVAICSIDAVDNGFDWFDMFFRFEIGNWASATYLSSIRKLVVSD